MSLIYKQKTNKFGNPTLMMYVNLVSVVRITAKLMYFTNLEDKTIKVHCDN